MSETDVTSNRPVPGTGRWKVLLLAALFILPMAMAYLLYGLGWRPQGTVNHGELVQSPRSVSSAELQVLDGGRITFSDLQGKWSLVYFGPAGCPSACMANLYKMRQAHIAQGEKMKRVQRVFIVTDTRALDLLRSTMRDYPDMRVMTGPAADIEALARHFVLPAGSPLDGLHRVYVVDPAGNFMMSYPADADPSGMRKDLVRLLKVSQTGALRHESALQSAG